MASFYIVVEVSWWGATTTVCMDGTGVFMAVAGVAVEGWLFRMKGIVELKKGAALFFSEQWQFF